MSEHTFRAVMAEAALEKADKFKAHDLTSEAFEVLREHVSAEIKAINPLERAYQRTYDDLARQMDIRGEEAALCTGFPGDEIGIGWSTKYGWGPLPGSDYHHAVAALSRSVCPKDIVEFGKRHGIPHFAEATWVQGFDEGFQRGLEAAHLTRHLREGK